jgi:transcriptional regulator with XRE-family HTH domain
MYTLYMVTERVGSAGKMLAANISRIRKRKKLSFLEVAARTEEVGQPIAVLGLRRIERGERRVDYDDLLTLAIALDTAPINLMAPAVSDTVPYPIGKQEYGTRTVREWISGGSLRPSDPEVPWAAPDPDPYPGVAELSDLLQWLPEDRRNAVLRDWLNETYEPTDEEVEEARRAQEDKS